MAKPLSSVHTNYANIRFAEDFSEEAADLLNNTSDGGYGGAINYTMTEDSETVDLSFLSAPQGYCTDGTKHYVIDQSAIYKRNDDATWTADTSNSSPFTSLIAGTDHLGDGCYYDSKLYIVANDFTSYTVSDSNQIAVYNTSDLSYSTSYDVSATIADNNAISGIGVDTATGTLYVCTWNADQQTIYKFDASDGSADGTVTLEFTLGLMQGVTYKSGSLYITQGTSSDPDQKCTIYKFNATTGACEGAFRIDEQYGYAQGIDYSQSDMRVLTYYTSGPSDRRVRYFTEPTLAPTMSGGTLTLDKTDVYRIEYPQQLPDDGTIIMRVKFRTLYNWNSLIDNQIESNSFESWVYSDGRLAWRIAGTGNITAVSTISADTWYDIALTWTKDNGTGTTNVYVDSVGEGTVGSQTWITPSTRGWAVAGGNTGNTKGDLEIDYLYMYDAVLSSTDISAIHTSPTDVFGPEITSVSTDDVIGATENPWNIAGSGFGDQ